MESNLGKKHQITLDKEKIGKTVKYVLLSLLLSTIVLSVYYFPHSNHRPIWTDISPLNNNSEVYVINFFVNSSNMFKDGKYRLTRGRGIDDESTKKRIDFFEFQTKLLDNEILIDNIHVLNNKMTDNTLEQHDNVESTYSDRADFKSSMKKTKETLDSLEAVKKNGELDLGGELVLSMLEASLFETEEEWQKAKDEQERKNREIKQRERWEVETIQNILMNKRENYDYTYNEDGSVLLKMQKAGPFKTFFVLIFPLIFTLKFTTFLLTAGICLIGIYAYKYIKKNVSVSLK